MHRHRLNPGAVLVLVGVVLAACTSSPAADTPDAAVRQAFRLVDEGKLEDLLAITCAAEQESTREQFGFGQLGQAAGMDLTPLFGALNLDQTGLVVTTRSVQGDRAEIHLGGNLAVSFDAERLRSLFREIAEQQGTPVDNAALDSMITALGATTQSLPINETVEMAREDGTWKLCSRLTLLP
jgi:hypothetical protein